MEGGKGAKGKWAADSATGGEGSKSQDNGGSGALPPGNITVNNNADTVAIFYPSPGVYNFHQHSHVTSGQEQTISAVGFRSEEGLGRTPFGEAIDRRQLLNSIGVVAVDRRAFFQQLPPLAIGQPMEVDSGSSMAAKPEGGPPEESAGKKKAVSKKIKLPVSSGGDDGDGSSGQAPSKQIQNVSPVQSTSKKAHPFEDIDDGDYGDVDTCHNNDDSEDSEGEWESI